MDLVTGATTCIQYSAPDITSTCYNNSVTVNSAFTEYSFSNGYFTDDFLFAPNCLCSCALGGSNPNSCPCSAGNSPFPSNQICTAQSVASTGCLFGRTSDACCNIGISGTARYYVADISQQGSICATISVFDGVSQSCEFQLLPNNQCFQCGAINISVTNIITQSKIPGDKWVYDTLTGRNYIVSSSLVNSLTETNPSKFGAIKVSQNGVLTIPTNYGSSLQLQSISCANDVLLVVSSTPQFVDIIPQSYSRNADLMPSMKTGVMFFDNSGTINWIGTDLSGNNIIGPNTDIVDNIGINFYNSTNSTLCADPGYKIPPYLNSSCIIYRQVVDTAWLNNLGWWLAIVECPGVRYLAGYFNGQNYSTVTYGPPQIQACFGFFGFQGELYPNTGTAVSQTWYFNQFYTPFGAGSVARSLDTMQSSISVPNYAGSAIVNFQFSGFGVSFQNQNLKPMITKLLQSDGYLIIEANSVVNKGNCLIVTYPNIVDDVSIEISPVSTEFKLPTYNIVFSGPVNVTITCGKFLYSKSIDVKLSLTVPESTSQEFSYSQWSNTPWYYNFVKIIILVVGLVILLWLIFKIYCYFFRGSMMGKTPSQLIAERNKKWK